MAKYLLKNGQTLIIRQADKTDAAQILEYLKKVGAETDFLTFGAEGLPITVEEEAKIIDNKLNSENDLMLCAIIDNQLVGILSLFSSPNARFRHTGEMGITVLKEFWGLGIGSFLIEEMLNWAKQSRIIRKINLAVRKDNERAIRLYQKFGFVQEGIRIRGFFVNNQFYDMVLMGLLID